MGKLAAVLAINCVTAHVPLVAGHVGTHPASSLVMAALSAACLPCAVHLWRGPRLRTWITAGALAASMLAVHLIAMIPVAGDHAPGYHGHGNDGHGDHGSGMLFGDLASPLMLVATILAVVQVALACAVIAAIRAGRVTAGTGNS
ncbi:hypothetical protein [Saccharopolyspora mangrovi]|uniref:Uncharacterized protein n=1 Tax=Saccharopolyspora mangrovi TaxID=3082379 RepID=A0ABU6AEZ9_9PSEU|nr:hypothetical protein [Saccharopolyspora sp. S2-29]MEB3370117.1 hypothetical protein [Saccharopolyspora sp. S2-29]